MRYLVTGGCGFIGHHYVKHLVAQRHEVVVLDRLDSAGHLGRIDSIAGVKFVRHDLASAINGHVDRAIGEVDIVVHLAAASHVDRSVVSPAEYLQDNVVGTFNLLEWARKRPIRKVMCMSTDEVFGPAPEGREFFEHDALSPANPYAATKAAAELLCPAWANTFDVPIVVVRCTNVIGSGQDPEKFVPLVKHKVLNDQLVQIHADPSCKHSSTRFYIHVSDVCRAFDTIITAGGILGGNGAGRYNITGLREWSNLEVAQRIAGLLGRQLKHELVAFVPNRPKHDQRYAVAGDRLRELGWEPRVGLDAGLREALEL